MAAMLLAPPATASGERRHARESRVRAKLAARGKLAKAVTFADGRLTIDAGSLTSGAGDILADSTAVATKAVKRTLSDVKSALKRPPRHLRGSDWATPSSVMVVSGRGGAPALQIIPSSTTRGELGGRAVGALLLAAGVVFALFAALQPNRRAMNSSGRWVRDRSLGGRLVQVADEDQKAGGSGASSGLSSNPLSEADSSSDTGTKNRRGITRAGPEEEEEAPMWWTQLPSPVLVSATRKAAYEKDAKAAVGRLNSARVGGRQYDVADFLQLRSACASGGITVDITAGDTARDALFRGAVELALTGAIEGPAALAGMSPGVLLSGLATDMRLSQRRAGTLVAAATAARVRGILLDALAEQRRAQMTEATLQMASLGALLRALPLPPSSPELDLVAAGLAGRTTEEERAALLRLFSVGAGTEHTLIVASALGMPLS